MEPISVVSFCFGAIGFLTTIRNGIETVSKDKANFDGDVLQLISFQVEIELLLGRIQVWRSYWRIDGKCSAAMLESYWGADRCHLIQQLLCVIEERCKVVTESFRNMYGFDTDQSPRIQLSSDSPRSRERADTFRRYIRKQRDSLGFSKRVRNSVFSQTLFQSQLDLLSKDVDSLEKLCEQMFKRVNEPRYYPLPSQDFRDRTYRTRLIDLAWRSSLHSASLLEICLPTPSHSIGLKIDLTGSQYSGLQDSHTAESTRAINLPVYSLLTPFRSSRGETRPIELVVAVESDPRKATCWTNPSSPAFKPSHPSNTSLEACEFCNGDCPQYFGHPRQLQPIFKTVRSVQEKVHVESLRSFICASKSSSRNGEFHPLSYPERATLALLVSEFVLLMLHTKWLSSLCSCTIMRMIPKTAASAVYAVQAGKVEHIEPGSAEFQANYLQWCEEGFKGMPIQRLGILLLEIGLGDTIGDAGCNPKTNLVEVDFEIDFADPDATHTSRGREIVERVSAEASFTFGKVVEWCLTVDHGRQGQREIDPELFFDNVLEPLYNQFRAEVPKRPRHARRLRLKRK